MLTMLRELASSKKAAATLAAVLVWLVGRFGFHAAVDDVLPVCGALLTFVLAQGVTDHGKSAAIVAASTMTTTSVASDAAATVVAVESKSVTPTPDA